eukprot:364844-Chlamydomonas_euryale.AAC.2
MHGVSRPLLVAAMELAFEITGWKTGTLHEGCAGQGVGRSSNGRHGWEIKGGAHTALKGWQGRRPRWTRHIARWTRHIARWTRHIARWTRHIAHTNGGWTQESTDAHLALACVLAPCVRHVQVQLYAHHMCDAHV